MIIDFSAIIAVINGEPEAIVADNRGETMRNAFDTLVDEMGLIIEPVTPHQASIARRAYQTYGKGNNSKAGRLLRLRSRQRPRPAPALQGEDFPHTDITPAQP